MVLILNEASRKEFISHIEVEFRKIENSICCQYESIAATITKLSKLYVLKDWRFRKSPGFVICILKTLIDG